MLKSIFVSDDSLKLFLLEFSIIFLEIIGLLILIDKTNLQISCTFYLSACPY